MSRPLILWGVHPAHGPLPLKIAEWTRAKQRRRESEGWTCAVYAQGDAPTGLALVTAIPLCPECIGAIGGACGGPDAPYRPALKGEACGAADCQGAPTLDRYCPCGECGLDRSRWSPECRREAGAR